MSHVLIYGQRLEFTELKARLKGWGMSSGALLPGMAHPNQVTVDDCDAVILDLRGNEHPVWLSKFLANHELAAPVLVLTPKDGITLRTDGHWTELSGDETVDGCLLLELQGAIAYSRQQRGLGAGSPGGSYLHFLGHELRSPLTAAKTALEALQGELSSSAESADSVQEDDAGAMEASLKMAEIAMRNIQRLQKTVEWSQDFLAHMDTVEGQDESLESSVVV